MWRQSSLTLGIALNTSNDFVFNHQPKKSAFPIVHSRFNLWEEEKRAQKWRKWCFSSHFFTYSHLYTHKALNSHILVLKGASTSYYIIIFKLMHVLKLQKPWSSIVKAPSFWNSWISQVFSSLDLHNFVSITTHFSTINLQFKWVFNPKWLKICMIEFLI